MSDYNKIVDGYQFDYIKIGLASPERIRSWGKRVNKKSKQSSEVTNPETINYRTLRPEANGLFCEKIFGPCVSWKCSCGKYKGYTKYGIICDECGVEITETRVRRHRMGYINLSSPVTHIWYLKGIPSYLALLLECTVMDIEDLVYSSAISLEDLLSSSESGNKSSEEKRNLIGAEILQDQIRRLDLEDEINKSRESLISLMLLESNQLEFTRDSEYLRLIKRIRLIENFISTDTKPEWMLLTVLPVIPPGLRPIIQLNAGVFACSDLNELYKKIIIRNNRLITLFGMNSPDIIVKNEKRMLQEAVDALIDNGRNGQISANTNNKPLKSLTDILEGKQGRFRQNLLGKRVDYSGRSVIVVEPSLKLHQCGLPYELGVELFRPFIFRFLLKRNIAPTLKVARNMIEDSPHFIWRILRNIMGTHPILLNRAPTLHRLGIQAFQPTLVSGQAIQLHPLVCSGFNADFDGDQMAVHIPLSYEARLEAKRLMLAPNNILSPASGSAITAPSQDIVLGLYYLTTSLGLEYEKDGHYFSSAKDVLMAYLDNKVFIHNNVWIRYYGKIEKDEQLIKCIEFKDGSMLKIFSTYQIKQRSNGEFIVGYIKTTVGRILFNQVTNRALKGK